jgi:hypothetical protein
VVNGGSETAAFRDVAVDVTIQPMTTDECIALSDDELVDATYAVADDLAESEDLRTEEAGDTLLYLLGELLERFAPEAARAELVRALTHPELGPLDAEDEAELQDALDALRRRQAARLLRDTLSG